METNENKNTMAKNLWVSANAVLRGKFIAIQAYLKKEEKSQINNLPLYLMELEKEQQRKPKTSRRKEIIQIRAEIDKTEKIKETKNWFFKKMNTCDKPLAKMIRKVIEETEMTNSGMKEETSLQNQHSLKQ